MLATVGAVMSSTSSSGSALLCDEVDVEPDDESDGDNEPPFSDDAEGDEASPTMGTVDEDEEGGDIVEWADVGDVVAAGAWC
jgi:hypothetical protein